MVVQYTHKIQHHLIKWHMIELGNLREVFHAKYMSGSNYEVIGWSAHNVYAWPLSSPMSPNEVTLNLLSSITWWWDDSKVSTITLGTSHNTLKKVDSYFIVVGMHVLTCPNDVNHPQHNSWNIHVGVISMTPTIMRRCRAFQIVSLWDITLPPPFSYYIIVSLTIWSYTLLKLFLISVFFTK